MNKLILASAALLATTAMPAAASVTLAGSTATATLLSPDTATTYAGPVSATVGASIEFPAGSFAPAYGSFDIGPNTITFFSNQFGPYGTGTFNGYKLDFTGLAITSLSVAPGSFVPNQYYYSGSSIYFSVSGQDPPGGNTIFNVGVAPVPEPATWAMMLMGLGMVGFGLRRRKKQTVRVTYA